VAVTGEELGHGDADQIETRGVDTSLIAHRQPAGHPEPSPAPFVDSSRDHDGFVDCDRAAEAKFHLAGDTENPFVEDPGPNQDLVEGRGGDSAVERSPRSPVFGSRGEPGADDTFDEVEVIEVEPDGVVTTTGETVVVIVTSDGVDQLGDISRHPRTVTR
jgi:hypothetical protein